MAEGEEEVKYASVVFKAGINPPPAAKRAEETVYGEVKVQNETKNEDSAGHRRFQHLACCLGILCVILLGGIIGVCVYLTLIHGSDPNQLKENSTLLEINTNLSLENANLTRDNKNLTDQLGNLTQAYNGCINSYCLGNTEDKCQACQKGWILTESSCYAYNNAETDNRKTWEEAREDCSGKNSDLAVARTLAEKEAIKKKSFGSKGFWIGLRVVNKKWEWVDGSDLTESSWVGPPVDGHCAVFFKDKDPWSSVRCDAKRQWICQKKALSLSVETKQSY